MLKADEPIELPDKMRGYLLLKHAHLNTNAHDTMTRWTANELGWDIIFKNLSELHDHVPEPVPVIFLVATRWSNGFNVVLVEVVLHLVVVVS